MQTCTTEWSLIPATVLLPSFDLIPGLTSPRRQAWDWVEGQECTYTVKFYIGSGVKSFTPSGALRRSQCTNGGAPAVAAQKGVRRVQILRGWGYCRQAGQSAARAAKG